MKKQSIAALWKPAATLILFVLFSMSTAIAQSKADKIDQLISKYAEYGQFNGSILVAENGKVIYKKGFGAANMEWDIPNQPNTKFRLGSISKQFTSMLIMQLVEKGKLALDAPITTYLSDYPKDNGDKITLHHLMTHSSGIPNYTSFPDFRTTSINPYTPEDFVKKFSTLPLEFEPGNKCSYSNSGYFLLGYIIEKVSGKSYEQNLQDSILTPLGMKDTGYDHHETIIKNRASGYEKKGETYQNAGYLDMSLPFAAGSLYSTVEDLYIWDQALYTEKLLSAKNRDKLFAAYIPAGKSQAGYGWFSSDAPGPNGKTLHIIQHGGGINGFNTIITRVPADKNLTVLLNNTGGAALDEMATAIRGILYGLPYAMPKKSLANALLPVMSEQGVAAGLIKLKELQKDQTYATVEREINTVGYQLLQSGKNKEAIEVFRINVETYPDSSNTYDSLAEAYLSDGNKKEALKLYKKAVAMDPTNENAKKVIQELSK